MRLARLVLCLSIALMAVVSTLAPADTFTNAVGPVITELTTRRDNDFAGELDKARKAQQKAVLAAFALVLKLHDDAGDDIKTVGKIAGKLEKPYAAEFAIPPGAANHFGPRLRTALDALQVIVQAAHDEQRARVLGLSEGGQKKVAKQLDSAVASINSSSQLTSPKARAAGLAKAWSSVAAAKKAADKDKGQGGGGASTLTATIGGQAFTGDSATKVEIYAANDDLTISGHATNAGGEYYIVITAHGVTGIGPIDAGGGVTIEGIVNHFPPGAQEGTVYTIKSGTLDVEIYDRSKRFKGTFSFGTNNATAGDLAVTGGAFDITNIERY